MIAFFSTLKGRLLLLVCTALIPAILLILYTVWQSYENELGNVSSEVLDLAISTHLERNIKTEGTHQLLTALAEVPDLANLRVETCNRILEAVLKNNLNYENLGVVDNTGNILCSAVPQKTHLNISNVAWYRHVLATHAFTVSEIRIGQLTGKPVQISAYPVFDATGRLKAVLFSALSMDHLSRIQQGGFLPKNSEILVFDRRGTILQSASDPLKWTGKTLPELPLIKSVIQQKRENSTIEATGLDGQERLYGVVRLGQEGQHSFLAVGIPKNYAYAGINKILLFSFAGLLLMTIIVLAIAWLGSTMLAGRIDTLVESRVASVQATLQSEPVFLMTTAKSGVSHAASTKWPIPCSNASWNCRARNLRWTSMPSSALPIFPVSLPTPMTSFAKSADMHAMS